MDDDSWINPTLNQELCLTNFAAAMWLVDLLKFPDLY